MARRGASNTGAHLIAPYFQVTTYGCCNGHGVAPASGVGLRSGLRRAEGDGVDDHGYDVLRTDVYTAISRPPSVECRDGDGKGQVKDAGSTNRAKN